MAGKVFYQHCIVQAARLDNKAVQTILLYLGSHPLLDDKVSREQILVSLKAFIFNQPDIFIDDVPDNVINFAKDFFAKYQEKHLPRSEELSFEDRLKAGFKPAENAGVLHTVYLDTIENTNVRSYGAENLCAQVVERLEIPQKLNELGFSQYEINVALMAILRLRNHVISTIEVKVNKSTIAIRKTAKAEKQTLEIYKATNTSSERKKNDVVCH